VWLKLLEQSFLSPTFHGCDPCRGGGARGSLALPVGALFRVRKGNRVLSALQCGLLLLVFSMNDAVDARYMYDDAVLPGGHRDEYLRAGYPGRLLPRCLRSALSSLLRTFASFWEGPVYCRINSNG